MEWLLIFYIYTNANYAITTAPHHFYTRAICEAVGKQWAADSTFLSNKNTYLCIAVPLPHQSPETK